MAELADAYGSGPYECKFMQVQVLLSAPKKESAEGRVLFSLQRAGANLQNSPLKTCRLNIYSLLTEAAP